MPRRSLLCNPAVNALAHAGDPLSGLLRPQPQAPASCTPGAERAKIGLPHPLHHSHVPSSPDIRHSCPCTELFIRRYRTGCRGASNRQFSSAGRRGRRSGAASGISRFSGGITGLPGCIRSRSGRRSGCPHVPRHCVLLRTRVCGPQNRQR